MELQIRCEELEKKWITVDEREYPKIETPLLDKALMDDLEASFPPRWQLSVAEQQELMILEQVETFRADEFRRMLQLKYKRGPSDLSIELHLADLRQLMLQCERKRLVLPPMFESFFSHPDYLRRFRFGDISFSLADGLVDLPGSPGTFLVPFLGDSQGFCWWSLLMDKMGKYCVVYRDLHWREQPEEGEDVAIGKYYACSATFDEFLVRLSLDCNKKEQQSALLT